MEYLQGLILKQVKFLNPVNILITGSKGYIGTATKELLIKSGYKAIDFDKKQGDDTRNIFKIIYLIRLFKPKTIVHLSAKKSIAESKKHPFLYYANNVLSTLVIAVVSRVANIPVVFSSSAAIYSLNNSYAKSKNIEEKILSKLVKRLVILRYFNIVGKTNTVNDNESNNIFSIIKNNTSIVVNSTTSTRDYIHVLDIARANMLAIEYLKNNQYLITDIFTGHNKTMLDVISEYQKNNYSIEYLVLDSEDTSIYPSIDNRGKLGWKPEYTFEEAIKSEILY